MKGINMIVLEFEGRKKVNMNLNMAPLIDIVFLLLIFFMLSSNFISQTGIKLTLPESESSKIHSDKENVVFISSESDIYLNEKKVSLDELQSLLTVKLDAAQKKNVIIKADKKIDLELAVKVMDIAKEAKAEGLIISTELKQNEK